MKTNVILTDDRPDAAAPNGAPAGGRPSWLMDLLLRRNPQLAARFSLFYRRLRSLPRPRQRQLRRKLATTLAGAALLLALSGAPAQAATINVVNGEVAIVANGKCSLIEAIQNAKATSAGQMNADCAAGNPSGADTINLPAGGLFTLTAVHNTNLGNNGLPVISNEIAVNGNGSTIRRAAGAPEFRIFAVNAGGKLTVRDTSISGGDLQDAGQNGGAIYNQGTLTIEGSRVGDSFAGGDGGAIWNSGTLNLTNSTVQGSGYWYYTMEGGGVFNQGTATITNSTISGNEAYQGGGIFNSGALIVTNSTLSGNVAYFSFYDGGGLFNSGTATLNNSTITGNYGYEEGGGVFNRGDITFNRTIVSGNEKEGYDCNVGPCWGDVWSIGGTVTTNNRNVFGHSGNSYSSGLPIGATDVIPSGPPASVLNLTLADNGGPTMTHALPLGSPAIDRAPNNACTAAPVNGVDQRGLPRNANGDGVASNNECDSGAYELQAGSPATTYFMTTIKAGTTADGVSFDKRDVLKWDGARWSLFFDGSARSLPGTADIFSFHIPDPATTALLLNFKAAVTLPGAGKVQPHDVARYDGSTYFLHFDGSDVGLSTTGEKIDALHQLPGDASPIGSGCSKYLLISTTGAGTVPNHDGGTLKFAGEDVLGFCATGLGNDTAGLWHMVLDGSEEGMPAGATFSLSSNADASILYLTMKGAFSADGATGSHSMVFKFDQTTRQFSGPVFKAADHGLKIKVDGLELAGPLP